MANGLAGMPKLDSTLTTNAAKHSQAARGMKVQWLNHQAWRRGQRNITGGGMACPAPEALLCTRFLAACVLMEHEVPLGCLSTGKLDLSKCTH
eukprot:1148734-Pelagomonas_calceolata.AAC.2